MRPSLCSIPASAGCRCWGRSARRCRGGAIVYAADNAGFPYGTKTEMEVATRTCALLGRLAERLRPELVVIACNTASTIALGHARAVLDVPIVGTVPAIKPAAEQSQTRVIGVLGTNATVRQPYVDRLSAEFASDCLVLRHGSARLVELAEAQAVGAVGDGRGRGAGAGGVARPARGGPDGHGGAGLHAFPAAEGRNWQRRRRARWASSTAAPALRAACRICIEWGSGAGGPSSPEALLLPAPPSSPAPTPMLTRSPRRSKALGFRPSRFCKDALACGDDQCRIAGADEPVPAADRASCSAWRCWRSISRPGG